MNRAFKVVGTDYRSYDSKPHPPLRYTLGGRIEPGPYGLSAYSTLPRARTRAAECRQPARVIGLDYADDQQMREAQENGTLVLAGCTVAGEVPLLEFDRWPLPAGMTVDLAPVAELLGSTLLPFLAQSHGAEHWRGTARIVAELAPAVPGADVDVAAAFALLHDAKRRDDQTDPDDGPLAAVYARALRDDGTLELSDEQLAVLCEAFCDYPPRTTDDPTIGLCWDACRLEHRREGITIPLLSTPAAVESGSRRRPA